MYHLLIVDDEVSVVDSLSLTIPWNEYGIEEVSVAYSAKEALDIAQKQAIDIVITDIRMPEMDGLELINHLKQFSNKTRCIILSGHDDFEYAKKAIRYQTMDYLLKPIDFNVLIQTVETAIQQIEEEWAEVSSYQRIEQTLHANMPLLKNQHLNDLLKNQNNNLNMIEERLEMIGVSFRINDPFMMMVVRLEEDFSGYDLQSLSLLEFAVSNIAEEVFEELFELWHCISDQGYLVFLIKSKNNDSFGLVDSFTVKLQNHVQKFLKGSISICLSNIGIFPKDLSKIYLASVRAIHRNVGSNKGYFLTLDNIVAETQEENTIRFNEPPFLSTLLESGNWNDAYAKIDRLLSIDKPDQEPSKDHLFKVLLYISSSFVIHLSSEGNTMEEQLGEEFDLFLTKKSHLSKKRILSWSEKMISSMKSKTSYQMEDSHQQIVSKVKVFIQENLANGISLNIIADHIGLHPVYLAKVYKTVTGSTIGDYIYSTRMERAVHFLQNTEMKISEISAKLGFLSPPHFIKIFKKQFDCTPQEYRNKLIEELVKKK